jgi:hypothetical protein
MDELDLINTFRSDIAGPSAAATARAERAWQRSPRARLRRRWAPRAAAGLLAAAAIAVTALVVSSAQDGRLGAASAEAAATLRHAAAHVRGLPRELNPGEYWYVRSWTLSTTSVEGHAGAYTVMGREIREEWTAADGTRRWTTRPVGPIRFPTAQDRQRWEADGSPDLSERPSVDHSHPRFTMGTRDYTYRQLLALPRDPQALYARLHSAAVACRCGNGVDDQTFVNAVELLRTNPLPTDLRAAILQATARIPGIDQHRERDIIGRPGLAVAYHGSQGTQVLIFDPATYELLGDREGEGGTADVAAGMVGSPTARP